MDMLDDPHEQGNESSNSREPSKRMAIPTWVIETANGQHDSGQEAGQHDERDLHGPKLFFQRGGYPMIGKLSNYTPRLIHRLTVTWPRRGSDLDTRTLANVKCGCYMLPIAVTIGTNDGRLIERIVSNYLF